MENARTGDPFARGIVVNYFHYIFEITLNEWNELKNLGNVDLHTLIFFLKRNSHYILTLCMQIYKSCNAVVRCNRTIFP